MGNPHEVAVERLAVGNPYEVGLERQAANYLPLTPLAFLARSGEVYAGKTAVVHGETRFTYAEFQARCRRLASALRRRGIGRRGHGGHHGTQRAGHAGGALRCPHGRRRPQSVELSARCAVDCLHPRARPRPASDRRPRVLRHRRGGAAPPPPGDPRGRHRRSALRGGRCPSGSDRLRGPPRRGRSRRGFARGLPTSGRPSAFSTPRGPPAIPKASSITTAAHISTPSAMRWPSGSRRARSICGRCPCSIAAGGRTPGR